jgi:hypothetical protein
MIGADGQPLPIFEAPPVERVTGTTHCRRCGAPFREHGPDRECPR